MEENKTPRKIPKQDAVVKANSNKGTKLSQIFKPNDVKTVLHGVLISVIVPSLKKLVDDVVSEGIHSFLYPNEPSRPSTSGGVFVNYATSFSARNQIPARPTTPTQTWGADFGIGQVKFNTRGDAEVVLASMRQILAQYKLVTVQTFFELSAVTTDNYQANSYGWLNLDAARVERGVDGFYRVALPRPIPMD